MRNDALARRVDDTDWEEQFRVSVRSAFGFLVDEFGYHEAGFERVINPTALGGPPTLHAYAPMDGRPAGVMRFEGPRATVEVAHDPRGEIHISLIDARTSQLFFLEHIVRFVGADPDASKFSYTGGFEGFSRTLHGLAKALRDFGGPWIDGHPEAVDALGRYAEVERGLFTARYTNDRREGTLPDRLHKACWNRDFAGLVRLLERIRGPLSEVEEKALAYAKDQLELERFGVDGSGHHSA